MKQEEKTRLTRKKITDAAIAEFGTKGSVTQTLIPMAALDDIVGVAVFFTVISIVARQVSGGAIKIYMIPVMIFLPLVIGAAVGVPTRAFLKKCKNTKLSVNLFIVQYEILSKQNLANHTNLKLSVTKSFSRVYILMKNVFREENDLKGLARWFHPMNLKG